MRPAGAVTIRAAVAADELGWRRLWQAYCDFYEVAIPQAATDALWWRVLDGEAPIHALVAELGGPREGALVGLANYVLHPYTWGTHLVCYLEDLFVADEARERGIGTQLIEALVSRGRREGWARVYWHTHELNEVARSVYEKIAPRDPFVRYVVKLL